MTPAKMFRSRSTRDLRTPKGVYVIRKPGQLAAIRSPVRQEIVGVLGATGIRTVAEIASMLGRSTHSLYHHVRVLERVGLIFNMGMQRRNRRDEVLYATPGRRLNIHRDPGSPRFLRNVRGLVAGMLRLTERDFVRAQARRVPVKVSSRNLSAGRIKGRLTAAQLREVRRLMERLYELMGSHPEQAGGTLHALTMVIAPLAEHASKKPGRPRRSTPRPPNARIKRARSAIVELKGAGT